MFSLLLGIVPGLYAMVGAAAALSGVTVCFFILLPEYYTQILSAYYGIFGRNHV